MPLDDAATKAGDALDAFGMKVTNAHAQLVSLLSYLLARGRDTPIGGVLGTTAQGTSLVDPPQPYDPNNPGRLGLPTVGGALAYPQNALGVILQLLKYRGLLDDPEILARISQGFKVTAGNSALEFRTEAEFVDFITRAVRNNQAGIFPFLLRQSNEGGGGDIQKEYATAGRWAGDRITLVGDYDESKLWETVEHK